MLVAMAILALLVVLLFQIANLTSTTWIQNEGRIESRENGRVILSAIAAEMQGAVLSTGGRGDLQFVVNPSLVQADQKNASAVFWQASIATDRRLGDIAEVGYFVRWSSSGQSARPQLCRLFVNPVDTGTSTLAANPYYLIYKQPNDWVTTSLLNQVAPADKQNSYAGLFSENVLGLWVRCLAPDGEVITKDASGAAFPDGTFDSRLGYTWSGGVQPPNSLPAAVEISLALIDSRAANRIAASAQPVISTALKAHANAASFVKSVGQIAPLQTAEESVRAYTTTVYLKNARK